MITFSIDTLPLSNEILSSNDYSSKIIYSAVTDPLFKYNCQTNSIVKNSCSSYRYYKGKKKLRIEIRKDLYYNDGQHITAKDYCLCFNKILLSNNHIGLIFKRFFNSVNFVDNYTFELENVHRNKKSFELLSIYSTGCLNEQKSSGPYYIERKEKNKIYLKRNKYYRKNVQTKEAEELSFYVTNGLNDYDLYNKNELQITNNTITELKLINKNNYNSERNYIFLNILFSDKLMKKENKNIRKAIANCINREKINDVLLKKYKINDSFILNDMHKNKKRKITKKVNNIELVLGYNNFYPNKMVATEIKKQLENFGFKISLVENVFNTNNSYDINLVLNHMEYIAKNAMIESSLFPLIFSSNFKYIVLNKLYYFTNLNVFLKLINKIIIKSNFKIPILEMQGYYLKKEKYMQFNYVELNYEDL